MRTPCKSGLPHQTSVCVTHCEVELGELGGPACCVQCVLVQFLLVDVGWVEQSAGVWVVLWVT